MEQYIVSARKYRPQTFRSVVGQEALTTTLKNAIATNHLAHAYLFCGPRGVGKTTCARIFAKTINCQHPNADGEACNECESCRGFNEQRSFNIHELDAASNNSVDDIRALVDQVRIPPQVGKYSVYIIDEVHMLSTAAFNAFLKTLEEPPSYAIFILATTEKHKIIPTILSRCQIYDFNRIRVSDTVGHLQYVAENEGVTAEPEALNVIAQKADGAMRDALSIFDQVVSFCGGNVTYKGVIENLNVLDYDYYFRLVDDFLEGQVNHSLMIFDEILSKGFEAQHFVGGLAAHFRDLLVSRDAETLPLLEVGTSIAEHYQQQAQHCPIPFLYKALELANTCDLSYRASRNKRLLVELLMVKLCQITGKVPTVVEQPAETIRPLNAAQAQAQATQTVVNQPVAAQPQQPIQPKPATIVQKPSPQPTTPKPSMFGVSISSGTISQNKTENTVQQTVSQPVKTEKQRNNFSERELNSAWCEFAGTIKTDAHVANTMTNFLPTKNADETFQVKVVNSLQQKMLEKYSAEILAFLRQKLSNDFINFTTEIDETLEQNSALTPEEKFAHLRQQNPEFDKLSRQLGLEL